MELLAYLLLLPFLGIATAAAVETLQFGSIFENYRAKAEIRQNFFDRLVLCDFCSSHSVAGILTVCVLIALNGSFWMFVPVVFAVRWIATVLMKFIPSHRVAENG